MILACDLNGMVGY